MNAECWDEKIQNLPYPSKEDFTVYHVMKKGKIIHSEITMDELKKIYGLTPLTRLKESSHVVEKDFNEDEFRLCQKNYRERIQSVYQEFKQYLFKEYSVSGSKAERLYEICSSRYQSCSSIEELFSEFVELIQE
jgi:hypothetical protein